MDTLDSTKYYLYYRATGIVCIFSIKKVRLSLFIDMYLASWWCMCTTPTVVFEAELTQELLVDVVPGISPYYALMYKACAYR